MKNKTYLWDTIFNKLLSNNIDHKDIDVRYLQKWIRLYPNCFPKFVIKGNYEIHFNFHLKQTQS